MPATFTSNKKTIETPYPVYSSQTKENGLMGFYKDYLYNDAITWTTDGANAGTVQYRTGKFYCTNVCGVLLSNKVKANQMIAEALNNVAKNYVSYVGNPKLMNNVMADIEIILSKNQNERESISKLFYTLDNIITLHQRKYFCSNNLIFTITTAWEQRKLINEVASIDTGKSKFVINGNGNYEILGSTSVIGYDNDYDYDGDFLLTARVGANAGDLYRYSGKVKISDNTVFIQGKQLDFIYYALLNFDIKRISFGTGQPLVKASELKVQKIYMPYKQERELIGKFLIYIDNLITLHQRECFFIKKEVQNVKFN